MPIINNSPNEFDKSSFSDVLTLHELPKLSISRNEFLKRVRTEMQQSGSELGHDDAVLAAAEYFRAKQFRECQKAFDEFRAATEARFNDLFDNKTEISATKVAKLAKCKISAVFNAIKAKELPAREAAIKLGFAKVEYRITIKDAIMWSRKRHGITDNYDLVAPLHKRQKTRFTFNVNGKISFLDFLH